MKQKCIASKFPGDPIKKTANKFMRPRYCSSHAVTNPIPKHSTKLYPVARTIVFDLICIFLFNVLFWPHLQWQSIAWITQMHLNLWHAWQTWLVVAALDGRVIKTSYKQDDVNLKCKENTRLCPWYLRIQNALLLACHWHVWADMMSDLFLLLSDPTQPGFGEEISE